MSRPIGLQLKTTILKLVEMILVLVEAVKNSRSVTGNNMRPIFWGLIFFGVGAVGWVVSVVLTIVTLGALKFLTYIFGILFALSLPVALVWELALWIKKKN